MPLVLIPADTRDAVADGFRRAFGVAGPDSLTPLSGGMSSALVCKAVVGGRACLLRVEMARDAFRDPVRQYACLQIAADAGVAPPLLYADATAGVAIMDFIAGRSLAEYPGRGPAMVAELGGLLARLQAAPTFPPLVDYFDGVDAVIANTLATGVLAPAAIVDHLAAWRTVRDAYPRLAPDRGVASHNDLNPGNILYDGRRLWLVDWESAFANDPHVDPAILATWFGLPGPAEDALLATVLGPVDDVRRARMLLMRQACQVFYAGMFFSLAAGDGAAPVTDLAGPDFAEVRAGIRTGQVQLGALDGRLLFAKAALNGVLETVRSPAFAAAAKVLGA